MLSPLLRLIVLPLSLLGLAACGQTAESTDPTTPNVQLDLISRGSLIVATCSGCHSDRPGAIASLTAYSEAMLIETMIRYQSEMDGTTVMHRIARGYSDDDIAAISAYLGADEALE